MVSIRLLFSLLLGTYSIRGVNAAKYCYCEGSPGFYYLGVEQTCKKLGTNWGPVNCDLGSSDVCKFNGNNPAEGKMTKPLNDWCQSKDRTGTDLRGKAVQGGKLICTDQKPGWVKDSCLALGDKGLEANEAGPPVDLGKPTSTTPHLIRRADESTSKYLRYLPEPKDENLVRTEKQKAVKKYSDGGKEVLIQIKELRLLGYEWRKVKGYDNTEGASDHTESAEIICGLEKTSGSETKAELKLSFGYSGFGATFGFDASLAHSFFAKKTEQETVKKVDTFFVPKGYASHLYQKVYRWESRVWFRLQSTGQPAPTLDREQRGNWTIGIEDDEPLIASLEFEIFANDKVVKRKEIYDEGTFRVSRLYKLKTPLYSMGKLESEKYWSPWVRDKIKELGFDV